MAHRRPLHVLMTAMCGVLLAAGAAACSSGGTTTSGGTTDTAVQSDQTEESQTAPPAESTGAEQPQSQQNQPAVELAALPVGGEEQVFNSGEPRCVFVSWSGNPVPDGVLFRITDVDVKGDFVAVDGGGGCDDPCPDHIFGSGGQHCNAKVAWRNPPGPKGLDGTLGLLGKCVAPDAVTCQQVQGAVDQQGKALNIKLSAPPSPGSSSSEESQSSAEGSSGSSG
jgi:hypothetical protein